MAAPCPSCNKFCSLSFEDPEVASLDVDEDGNVSGECTIERTSECCAESMKTATFEIAWEPSGEDAEILKEHRGEGHSLSVEEAGVEQVEEGGGRFAKSYFGATVHFDVTCECQCQDDSAPTGAKPLVSSLWTDKIEASAMDEA